MIAEALLVVALVILFVAAYAGWDLVKWIARKFGQEIVVLPLPDEGALLNPFSGHGEYYVIGPATWQLVQSKAKSLIERMPDAHPEVMQYWKQISSGTPPMRLHVVEVPPNQRR